MSSALFSLEPSDLHKKKEKSLMSSSLKKVGSDFIHVFEGFFSLLSQLISLVINYS